MLNSIFHKEKTFTLGILGGGQLAKMLSAAAYRLGLNVAIIENHSFSPAGDMTKNDFTNGWQNYEDLDKFIDVSDIITLENEFINPDVLNYISKKRQVFPSAKTMELIQDKLIQKRTFEECGLEVPYFEEINSIEEAVDFGKNNGYPYILKVRKNGYDGYGNATCFNEESAIEGFKKFKDIDQSRQLMAEKFINFRIEIAVIVARNQQNEIAVYPTVETVQYRHICHQVIAPAAIDESLRKKAQEIAVRAVESINGIGVFGVEMFLSNDNAIIINEIAPRPHNSGHYTIEACFTSQFENAIRAVCNLPLGSPAMICNGAAMINLLGERDGFGTPTNVVDLLRHNDVFLHLYNKKKSRIGRKMGHITALAETSDEALTKAKAASEAIIW